MQNRTAILHCFHFFGNFKRFARCRRLGICYRTGCNHCWRSHRTFHSRSFLSNLMSKKLEHEFEILANSLKSGDASNQELSIPALAERIAKTLHVKLDEVAIFAVSEKWRHLCFLVPQALRNVGHIPLSRTSALAARTVRDSRRKSSIISRRFVTPAFSKASKRNR